MKGKKSIFKKVLLVLLIVLVLGFAIDLVITEVYSHKIPHRYASAKEGRELMLSNDEYFNNCSQNDLDYRMQKTGATLEEYRNASADGVKSFNIFEMYFMEHRIASIQKKLEKNSLEFPDIEEFVFIKTNMKYESGNNGYTHGTQIYLASANVSLFPFLFWDSLFTENAEMLICHEMFHCLSRTNPDFRAQMYSVINFSVAESDFELPECVRDRYLSNPDVEHHNAYSTFNIEGQDIECFLVWTTTESFSDTHGRFSDYDETVLVPIDGSNIYYTIDQVSNFDEMFGSDSDYADDPEEIMAYSFTDAVIFGMEGRDGNGYSDPEIISGILDILRR